MALHNFWGPGYKVTFCPTLVREVLWSLAYVWLWGMCIQSWLGWCVHCWPRICISLGHHSEYLVWWTSVCWLPGAEGRGLAGEGGGGREEEGKGGKGGRGGKKSNGCLKIKEVRGIFHSEIFYAYPSLLLLLAFLPLSQPAPISHQVTASHHRLLCVYWKCLSSLSLPVNDGKWGACCWATNSKRCCPLCDFYIIALELVDWGWHCVLCVC